MTTPIESDDRVAYIRVVILARCPELTDADLATLTQAETASTQAVLPDEIGRDIIDAIVALEAKVDWLAEAVGVNDDDAARRRAG